MNEPQPAGRLVLSMAAWRTPPRPAYPNPHASVTSMIISDNLPMRNALADTIAGEGAAIVALDSIEEAVERLNIASFPLIFAPRRLPDMSGSDICRRLRATAHGDQAWIIALPNFDLATPQQVITSGFDGYIRAPFEPGEIALLLAGASRNQRSAERLRQAETLAATLGDLTASLADCNSPEEIGYHLLATTCRQIPGSGGAVWLRDTGSNMLHCVATAGLSGDYPLTGSQIFAGYGDEQWANLARQPEYINTTTGAPRVFIDVARSEGYVASLSVALFTPAGVLGVLVMYLHDHAQPAVHQVAMLETCAGTASLAFDRLAARQQTEMLRTLIEHLPDGVFVSDLNGEFVMVNPALEEMTGMSRAMLEQRNLFDLLVDGVSGAGGAEVLRTIRAIVNNRTAVPRQESPVVEVLQQDRPPIRAELHLRPLPVSGWQHDILIQGVLHDVTERERARLELDVLRATAEATSTATSLEQITRAVCSTLRTQVGYKDVVIWLMHRNGKELITRREQTGLSESIPVGEGAPGRAAQTGETVFLRGTHGPFTVVGQPQDSRVCIPLVSNSHVVGIVDVTGEPGHPLEDQDVRFLTALTTQLSTSFERIQLHLELRRRATIDSVTGLENRETFLRRLEDAIANTGDSPLSLLIVGVDSFKAINDTYGHLIADNLLKQVAETLKSRIRPPQTIARYTSDQFAVILPGVSRADAPAIGENLRIGVGTQLFMAAEQVEQMTVSVGAASYPTDAGSLDQLLLAASHAMYLAKQAGRNQVYQSNEAFAELAAAHGRIVDLLRQSPQQTLSLLVRAVDQRTPERAGHSQRVADYALALARTLGMAEDELAALRIAAVIHDIGMFSLPDSLLRKPAGLSDSERELLYSIPINAHRLLSQVPLPASVLPAVIHQHEHWDGSGYPSGLRGEMIPPGARIIAVADAIDAMTSERAHRHSLTMQEALQALSDQAGQRYDPDVVRAAHSLLGEFDNVRRIHQPDLESTLDEALSIIPDPERASA